MLGIISQPVLSEQAPQETAVFCLSNLLSQDRTLTGQAVTTQKALMEVLTKALVSDAQSEDYRLVIKSLIERERLGSTGIGHGIAIPHARIPDLEEPIGALIRLDFGVDFSAIDNNPVNLIFGFLVPELDTDQHLKIIASLAEMLDQEENRSDLLNANNEVELYNVFVNLIKSKN